MLKDSLSRAVGALENMKVRPRSGAREVGRVESIEGSVVLCSGLCDIGLDELVDISGRPGLVISLKSDFVGVALLSDPSGISAGDRVRRVRRLADVPVGPGLLGRVVDPLGRAIDGLGPVKAKKRYPIERPAPSIMERAPVSKPLQTGVKIVDSLVPIGRGQRELILGDRQTGKTSLAVDAIINQKGSGVVCVYCAIGSRMDQTAKVVDALKRFGAMSHTVVIAAPGEASPGLLYIAPYAAASVAEYFMEEEKKDVLVVYNNLTSHASAYRQLSLFLRRPPGREAYPGDIFYIHSRLLERATKLKKGGSVTALPICETLAENISAYIPTNLISITDGQIFLSARLFQKGVAPALDVGASVSRVGSKAQLPAYKEIAGAMKIAFSQFEELEAFSRFGAQLDADTKARLVRGARIREVLKQPLHEPMRASGQIVVIFAANAGLFDLVPLDIVSRAAEKLVIYANKGLPGLMKSIDSGAPLNARMRADIKKVAVHVLKEFQIAEPVKP
ncbi:MAG: F0F1 ATP synthase subunit alpha [Rickettsiales bacterium]|jgi:F-type H+-transporting ATPase subunit alpha|nr:F0F1 ATP synthase subunit alpha [Rickettsiales bacterium]